jgi:hypothetical protein
LQEFYLGSKHDMLLIEVQSKAMVQHKEQKKLFVG